jgi:superfamily II DNA or RNA helicase
VAKNLRPYQLDALNSWLRSGNRGILEMATGTGKTFTARHCILNFMSQQELPVVVVTAPTHSIALQWKETLQDLAPIVTFDRTDWRSALSDRRTAMSLGLSSQLVVIAIQNTASMPRFHEVIDPLIALSSGALLVADEVHALGAPYFRKALRPGFSARLGLSATPNRWFDDAGTDLLLEYFGGVVFIFGIHEALNWIDPETGQTPLCPYEYEPVFVDLSDKEFADYLTLSKKISELIQMGAEITRGSAEKSSLDEELEAATFARSDILKSAEFKSDALAGVVSRFPRLKNCLVYCTDRDQMAQATSVLNDFGLVYKLFTGEEGTFPVSKYGGKSEREWILDDFTAGRTQVLVAMKCLDEGVDIPSAQVGIIMASTTNPREFIQRRGRLLRRAEGKDRARIFDLVVAPSASSGFDSIEETAARKIFYKEMERVEEFAKDAIDSTQANAKVVQQVLRMGRGRS